MEGGALTLSDASRLGDLEAKIARHIRSFIEAGGALREIRTDRLYRQNYPTFEEYCEERWNFQRFHAYRLVAAAAVYEHLKQMLPIGNILPQTESQARELVRLDDPEFQVKAWEGVLARVNGTAAKITAKMVREEVERFLPADDSDEPFVPAEEAAQIRHWLIRRLKDWPEEYRSQFGAILGGIVEHITDAIREGHADEDD